MTRFFLLIAVAALTIASLAAAVREGEAASAVCVKLQRQLAFLSSGRSRSFYVPDIRQLQDELKRARAWARYDGCVRGLFSQPNYSPECISRNAEVSRLQAEIAHAKQAARYGTTSSGSPAERRRIMAALEAYDCGSQKRSKRMVNQRRQIQEETYFSDTAYAPAKRTRSKAALRLKKEREQERARERQQARVRESAVDREWERESEPVKPRMEKIAATNEGSEPVKPYNVKGGLRTLCVRTCDGYYFPISFSTNKKFFARDESACSAMCPGTEVKLYYHNVKDGDSEDMVSAENDTPYTDLPTAFNYRKLAATPGCSCQAATRQSHPVEGTEDLLKSKETPGEDSRKGDAAPAKMSPFIGIPRPRPDPAADPETVLNTEGGLNREDLIRLTEKDPGAISGASGARVRVVGPTFFPDRQEAKGLRAPGRSEAR
ncbi:DUF2865 domain-containing protein [Brucella sp. IR073]|uniref:DUF2865 domain-containing protein n=1 Tax=unclassified Brucella TaxID=2632610 RepID=UPI003B9858D9